MDGAPDRSYHRRQWQCGAAPTAERPRPRQPAAGSVADPPPPAARASSSVDPSPPRSATAGWMPGDARCPVTKSDRAGWTAASSRRRDPSPLPAWSLERMADPASTSCPSTAVGQVPPSTRIPPLRRPSHRPPNPRRPTASGCGPTSTADGLAADHGPHEADGVAPGSDTTRSIFEPAGPLKPGLGFCDTTSVWPSGAALGL